jgi:hypothetical protein
VVYPDARVFWVAGLGLGALLILCVSDAVLVFRAGQPAGRWVEAWARRFPVLAFFLACVLGLLVGHFYWSTPAPCPTVPGQYAEPDCVHSQSQSNRAR